jgi:hypothetical protein
MTGSIIALIMTAIVLVLVMISSGYDEDLKVSGGLVLVFITFIGIGIYFGCKKLFEK